MTRIPKPQTDPCHDKEQFISYAEADRTAWFATARRRNASDDGYMLAAYFCQRCKHWHIGDPRKEAAADRWSGSFA